ncbi:TetR/AcrR family transcriptional regulator, partial [Streptomyces sp. NPDC007162]|uniref:TetR/AcrR family transcriptional regulator n=1 Tax=Streptomyces sp. NPDC007162 TaxID=3156917 RepID=UPI0033CDBCA7
MPTSAPPRNRFERRRAETRQALIRAARQILAETGDTSASIQAIAERADVGFGSFYNHFESKTELFDASPAWAGCGCPRSPARPTSTMSPTG